MAKPLIQCGLGPLAWARSVTGVVAAATILVLLTCSATDSTDPLEAERSAMIRTIESYRDEASQVLGRRGFDPRVLDAIRAVPRHLFVPENQQGQAYDDGPVPIGFGQTVSQPLIVALMTDLLNTRADHVVLEVGTGSGYQAAVLAHLVRHVYTIEIVTPLAEQARTRLTQLGYDNVQVRTGDGYIGWQEAGPFDGILVTAAADHIPPQLVQQLKPSGRMVIPLRDVRGIEHLTLVEVDAGGTMHTRQLLPVRFVPLTGR